MQARMAKVNLSKLVSKSYPSFSLHQCLFGRNLHVEPCAK